LAWVHDDMLSGTFTKVHKCFPMGARMGSQRNGQPSCKNLKELDLSTIVWQNFWPFYNTEMASYMRA
jgi:hypothetical protein